MHGAPLYVYMDKHGATIGGGHKAHPCVTKMVAQWAAPSDSSHASTGLSAPLTADMMPSDPAAPNF